MDISITFESMFPPSLRASATNNTYSIYSISQKCKHREHTVINKNMQNRVRLSSSVDERLNVK